MTQNIDDLEGLLKYLGSKPVHLVGHSYGASIRMYLALKSPELIRNLILAEPPAISLFVSN